MAVIGTLRPVPAADWSGFRVESHEGPLGTAEEAWLGPDGKPAGVAVRLTDGRRGLLLAEHVEAALVEERELVAAEGTRLLELEMPRLERATGGGRRRLSASWETTGAVLPMPSRRPLFGGILSRFGPVSSSEPVREAETPLWRLVAVLYSGIALLALLLIGASFLVGHLVAG